MRFAENNRISHRQLFRQIILVFPAPFLLCLFKNGEMLGVNAMAGTILAAVLLSFYVIWLIRLAPAYGELSRMTGKYYCTVYWTVLSFICNLKCGFSGRSPCESNSPEPDQRDFREMAVICLLWQHAVWERTGECREEEGLQKFPEGFFWQGFSFL